ncbi:MAG: zinc-finger domain-containing protein [Betaproteobacteria bacterium]|jgi:uncharacterized Zn-finger protein|nr:zinc-finger domain-containing protein [Rubrivivax sp.]
MSTKTPKSVVELAAADLQGPGVIPCPNPKMALWSNHPRVFIDLSHGGEGVCPYCGTVYRLKAGEHLHAHH